MNLESQPIVNLEEISVKKEPEMITVMCNHPDHIGDPYRNIRKDSYYDPLDKPLIKHCRSCAYKNINKKEEIQQNSSNSEVNLKFLKNSVISADAIDLLPKNDKPKPAKKEKKVRNPLKCHRKGFHDSPKANIVYYRSSYEKKAYVMLDEDPNVSNYYAESICIRYLNTMDNNYHLYFIDIKAIYTDGIVKLIEVKPGKRLEEYVVNAKINAGKAYATSINALFEVWTENILFGKDWTEKTIRLYAESLTEEGKLFTKEELAERHQNKEKARGLAWYRNNIANDKVLFVCECGKTHKVIRRTFLKNIERNGKYLCASTGGRKGGKIGGSRKKTKLMKENPYATEGKKECTKCKLVKPYADFSIDKDRRDGYASRCRKCRSTKS